MVDTRADYPPGEVAAARAVMLELVRYPGALDALVREFRPHLQHGLVVEGLHKIREKFLSPDHVGPKSVADFEELTDHEARDSLQRDAFERMGYLLAQLRVA